MNRTLDYHAEDDDFQVQTCAILLRIHIFTRLHQLRIELPADQILSHTA